jgi:signal transduction histidine kinase
MITLIPSWAHHYDEFWKALRSRNLWFIKLRYGAVVMLAFLTISAEFLLGFRLDGAQETAITVITLSILMYNIFLHWLRKFIICEPDKFNPLHLSLIQMFLDIFALLLLLYFTGSIESPLLLLFIFHMIIGSMVLPGIIMYSAAALLIFVISAMVYLEYGNMLTHYSVQGFLQYPVYQHFPYITSVLVVFAFVIIISVLLANKIAKQLYKMEQELVESIDRIEASEIEKQQYIIGVVHEIKTPLSALHSYLDIVLQKYLGPIDSKVEEKLIRARVRSAEAIDMINNVLKISRLRLMNDIARDDVDIEKVICNILEKQKIEFNKKNIKLTFNDIRPVKKNIKGDDFLLEIAFSNLIGNALKYGTPGGIVDIVIKIFDHDVEIRICDNGIGIPVEDIDRIFQDFYRASNIRNQDFEGTGLGLSIVKKIIESHGGEISVESPSAVGTPENPGACFTVILPEN